MKVNVEHYYPIIYFILFSLFMYLFIYFENIYRSSFLKTCSLFFSKTYTCQKLEKSLSSEKIQHLLTEADSDEEWTT